MVLDFSPDPDDALDAIFQQMLNLANEKQEEVHALVQGRWFFVRPGATVPGLVGKFHRLQLENNDASS